MKSSSLRIIVILVAAILTSASPIVSFAAPAQTSAQASRTASSARKKTTAKKKTTTKKKTATKTTAAKKKSTAAKTSASSSRSTAAQKSAAPVQNEAAASALSTVGSAAKTDSKRKIVVEKPDLDEIRRVTLDPSSKFYFPKLKKKYEVNDTTMTPEEFRNFYLGYMFQEDFDPYRVSPYSSMTDALRSKPSHTKEEIDTITKYAQLALEDNPFDLRQMSFLVHVLKEKRKDMRAKIWEYRLEHLLGAIKSTGTGDSVENAWYVMYPEHEYDMVQLLGYEATDAQYIEPGYDYLTVRPDESDTRKRDKSAKGFYFNVIVPQQQYELKHPEDIHAATDGSLMPDPEAPLHEETDPDDIPAE
ncbi:MAG: DUF4919 domain-containing protein [Muribaculaceae bacterium]|nr:DUF4919 domain-containing protein [Muribaculaceae bacterium]